MAAEGWQVAIVESREFGGTCALRGCNPKKVYVNAAAVIDLVRRTTGKLIVGDGPQIDWSTLHHFKQEFTQPVIESKESSLGKKGIETIHGTAAFVDHQSLQVGQRRLSAGNIVVAAGAYPRPLNVAGEEHITLSDAFLDLPDLPAHVAFIGGGYVSMEFAHVVARSGRKVTVIEQNDRVLSGFDPELVESLTAYSRRCGIDFRFNTAVTGIERGSDDSRMVQFSDGECLQCGLVVHGAGRVPNIADMNLKAGQVDFQNDGIVVDRHLRSRSNPIVYAVGDCAATASPPLTPVANRDADVVIQNLVGDQPTATIAEGPVPKAAFTTPSIAAVGLSQREAEERGIDVLIRSGDMTQWGSIRKVGSPAAGYKLLIDRTSGLIVGAHLLGPAAEETINLFALAMKSGITIDQFQSVPFVFPTFASDAGSMS